jgi:hypothetical protein
MSADLIIPDAFTTQFGRNFTALCQQMTSRLRGRVMVKEGCTGEAETHNQVGTVSSENVTGQRYKKVNLTDLPTAKRWIRPEQFQTPTGESKWDPVGLLPTIAPNGLHTMAHAAAFGRDMDDVIIAGLGGTAYTGKTGVTATALPSGQKVAQDYAYGGGGSAIGLTIPKILRALRILADNEAWTDESRSAGYTLQGIMSPVMEEALQTDASSTTGSRLFDKQVAPPVLDEQGRIRRFLGIDWTVSSRPGLIDTSDATLGYAYIWVSKGLQLDIWGDLSTTIDRRPDLSNAVQFLSQYSMGASRLEEETVIQIGCDIDV